MYIFGIWVLEGKAGSAGGRCHRARPFIRLIRNPHLSSSSKQLIGVKSAGVKNQSRTRQMAQVLCPKTEKKLLKAAARKVPATVLAIEGPYEEAAIADHISHSGLTSLSH